MARKYFVSLMATGALLWSAQPSLAFLPFIFGPRPMMTHRSFVPNRNFIPRGFPTRSMTIPNGFRMNPTGTMIVPNGFRTNVTKTPIASDPPAFRTFPTRTATINSVTNRNLNGTSFGTFPTQFVTPGGTIFSSGFRTPSGITVLPSIQPSTLANNPAFFGFFPNRHFIHEFWEHYNRALLYNSLLNGYGAYPYYG